MIEPFLFARANVVISIVSISELFALSELLCFKIALGMPRVQGGKTVTHE